MSDERREWEELRSLIGEHASWKIAPTETVTLPQQEERGPEVAAAMRSLARKKRETVTHISDETRPGEQDDGDTPHGSETVEQESPDDPLSALAMSLEDFRDAGGTHVDLAVAVDWLIRVRLAEHDMKKHDETVEHGEDDISDFLEGPPPAIEETLCGEDDDLGMSGKTAVEARESGARPGHDEKLPKGEDDKGSLAPTDDRGKVELAEDDIVERLREWSDTMEEAAGSRHPLCDEAADEIERLRAEAEDFRRSNDACTEAYAELLARLRRSAPREVVHEDWCDRNCDCDGYAEAGMARVGPPIGEDEEGGS